MAVITRLPEQALIDGFKGHVDFYVHKGQVCARRWPRYYPRTPTTPEKANQDAFAYAMKTWASLPLFIQRQYWRMAVSTPFKAQDIYIRTYLSGLNP